MKERSMDAAKDWMALLLMGLGINLAPHEFMGGLFMALGMAMLARHFLPEVDQREVAMVLLAAALMAIFAAEVAGWLVPEWPTQIIMAAAGFFSRYLIRMALRIAGRVETKTNLIADRLIDKALPPGEDRRGGDK